MMYAPVEKQRQLIRGAWRGDGYFHKPTQGNKATFFEYATTSQALAFQLQQLLMRNGLVGEIASTHHKNRKRAFVLAVRGRFVPGMAKLMRIKFKDTRKKTFTRFETDNNYVYAPILKISSSQVTDQPVVNLSVEGDESYVAGNVTAHNCTDYCPTGALDYTPDYELAEYDRELLLWSPERLSRPATNIGEYHSVFHGNKGSMGVTYEPVNKQKSELSLCTKIEILVRSSVVREQWQTSQMIFSARWKRGLRHASVRAALTGNRRHFHSDFLLRTSYLIATAKF